MFATNPFIQAPNAPLALNPHLPHLLLCATGSVATIKLPLIVRSLSRYRISIRIVLTSSAAHFLQGQSSEQPTLAEIRAFKNIDAIYQDQDEWNPVWTRGGAVLHIELRRWADYMVIAPLSANSLAKMAGGLCDNLLLSVVRAWDAERKLDPVDDTNVNESQEQKSDSEKEGDVGTLQALADGSEKRGRKSKRLIIVAPAMNTAMWMHPVTTQHMKVLRDEWGVDTGGWFEVLMPIEKRIACGDIGGGAMKEWKEIVEVIEERLRLKQEAGRNQESEKPLNG